ncbi:MAG: hypothetical protein D6734_05065 [Candidatus Schekmanbacteria bacterium]|nr:MAG: hypothetical protein D6734_05065 [Candidatus Schekmanbacteria bacterium]
MSQINKSTKYFLITVIVFGIIPLGIMRIKSNKNVAEAVKTAEKLPKIEEHYEVKSEEKMQNNKGYKTPTSNEKKILPLERDPFSNKEALNYLMISDSYGDRYSLSNNTGKNAERNLDNLKLQGIVIDGDVKYSIINDKVVEEGGEIQGCRVVSISTDEVMIEEANKVYSIKLND